eukprot:GHVT01088198.1.p1 GENE.GHVT01088198.1~~GHVT01088198.1.p1  ORF type:complete len:784 (+),score=106.78 GHVT01088198.1:1138-3489(+)
MNRLEEGLPEHPEQRDPAHLFKYSSQTEKNIIDFVVAFSRHEKMPEVTEALESIPLDPSNMVPIEVQTFNKQEGTVKALSALAKYFEFSYFVCNQDGSRPEETSQDQSSLAIWMGALRQNKFDCKFMGTFAECAELTYTNKTLGEVFDMTRPDAFEDQQCYRGRKKKTVTQNVTNLSSQAPLSSPVLQRSRGGSVSSVTSSSTLSLPDPPHLDLNSTPWGRPAASTFVVSPHPPHHNPKGKMATQNVTSLLRQAPLSSSFFQRLQGGPVSSVTSSNTSRPAVPPPFNLNPTVRMLPAASTFVGWPHPPKPVNFHGAPVPGSVGGGQSSEAQKYTSVPIQELLRRYQAAAKRHADPQRLERMRSMISSAVSTSTRKHTGPSQTNPETPKQNAGPQLEFEHSFAENPERPIQVVGPLPEVKKNISQKPAPSNQDVTSPCEVEKNISDFLIFALNGGGMPEGTIRHSCMEASKHFPLSETNLQTMEVAKFCKNQAARSSLDSWKNLVYCQFLAENTDRSKALDGNQSNTAVYIGRKAGAEFQYKFIGTFDACTKMNWKGDYIASILYPAPAPQKSKPTPSKNKKVKHATPPASTTASLPKKRKGSSSKTVPPLKKQKDFPLPTATPSKACYLKGLSSRRLLEDFHHLVEFKDFPPVGAFNHRTEYTAMGEELCCCDFFPKVNCQPPVPATVQLFSDKSTHFSAVEASGSFGKNLCVCAATGAVLAVGWTLFKKILRGTEQTNASKHKPQRNAKQTLKPSKRGRIPTQTNRNSLNKRNTRNTRSRRK